MTNDTPTPPFSVEKSPVDRAVRRRIAVSVQDGALARHFGKAKAFAIFRVLGQDCGRPVFRVRTDPRHECGCRGGDGSHRSILSALEGCDLVLCGGIGRPAAEALRKAGVSSLVVDAEGLPEEICRRFVSGGLRGSAAPTCEGHHH